MTSTASMALLGELLLSKAVITPQQLREGRERQKQLGGRLGSALIELGAISEETLLTALSEQLRVPIAHTDELKNIPSDTIALLSPALAARCEAIPFRESATQVWVAMLDVRNLTLQDELSFALGRKLAIHIANEARVLEALETYYDKECPTRFHSLIERLNRASSRVSLRPAPAPKPSSVSSPAKEAQRSSSASTAKPVKPAKPAKRGPLRGRPTPALHGPVSIPLSPEERAALAAEERLASGLEPARDPVAEIVRSTPEPATAVARFERNVEGAETPQEVGEALIEALHSLFDRCLVFQVRRQRVAGWLARGGSLNGANVESYAATLEELSVFRDLAAEDSLFTGVLPQLPAHLRMLELWHGAPGEECVVAPVKVRERLVAVIYGDRGGRGLEGLDTGLIERLARRASEAFARCIALRKGASR